jgi:hypothetical protein
MQQQPSFHWQEESKKGSCKDFSCVNERGMAFNNQIIKLQACTCPKLKQLHNTHYLPIYLILMKDEFKTKRYDDDDCC